MSREDFHKDYDRAPWRKVPLSDLTTYTPGRVCCAPAYWAITDDGFALFYGSSAQCNTDARIVKHLHPTLEARLIEQAYRPQPQE